MPHHFISHSNLEEAKNFAIRLHDALQHGTPSIACWLDLRDLMAGRNWDTQIQEAIRDCTTLLFIMTPDSVVDSSVCYEEWTLALKYKKIVIPIRLDPTVDAPFRLHQRQWIDFSRNFDQGITQLRDYFRLLDSPRGRLIALQDRLKDAERDVRRATDDVERGRIQAEIVQLKEDIVRQEEIVNDPAAAEKRTAESIERRLELERNPEQPITPPSRLKFINAPPASVPPYFQNRHIETRVVADFLKHPQQRLLTVVGRSGIGKTAMVVRVLRALERGELPDDLGKLDCNGIVYFSAVGDRRLNLPNLFEDMCKLLPPEQAEELQKIYREPTTPTAQKMRALLANLPTGRTVILLDNFETLLDAANTITDAELAEALRAVLNAAPHGVKFILTTRRAPERLMLVRPQFQRRLDLDKGLESPFAENILREMDEDGVLGLKALSADDPLLRTARERTRGYPMALEALYGILSADRSTTLPEILEQTQQAASLPENVVEVLVGEAFSRLDELSQRVMQALAIYARPVPPVAVDYLLQPFMPGVDSAVVLRRLVNMHFAQIEHGRFNVHPVDAAFALSKIPRDFAGTPYSASVAEHDTPFTQTALYTRAADYFQSTRKPREEWNTLEDLAPQLAEFELRFAAGDFDAAARTLIEIDVECLLVWGQFRLVAELHERLQGRIHDEQLQETHVGNLGIAYWSMGQGRRAISFYGQALELARNANRREGEGIWLDNLGKAYHELGEVRQAINYYEQALVIALEVKDRRGEGARLGNLGQSYSALGELEKAIEYYEQALVIALEVKDRHSEVTWLGRLGVSYYDLGQIYEARRYHEQALAIARQIGFRLREGIALSRLGQVYGTLGQSSQAISYYEQALEIAREIGYWRGEGMWLASLGKIYHALGQLQEASDYYGQALVIKREVGYRRGEATDLDNIGRLHLDQGDLEEASQAFQMALQIADKSEFLQTRSDAREGMAQVELTAGRLAEAQQWIEAALVYAIPENAGNIRVLQGIILVRQNDFPPARDAFMAAYDHANDLLSKTAENYAALDTLGLAHCGILLCDAHIAAETGANEAFGMVHAHLVADTTKPFQTARKIINAPGVVRHVLRLYDELKQADTMNVLSADIRTAAGGE